MWDLSIRSMRFLNALVFSTSSRPHCFQIVVQHFSEEQYIFYFAGEAPEHAQVKKKTIGLCSASKMKGFYCDFVVFRMKFSVCSPESS